MTSAIDEARATALGRRFLLRGAAVAGLATALEASSAHAGAGASGPSDFDILNFALNLEYLEAEFYLRAASGRGLRDEDTTGRGQRGNVSGGRRVDFATGAIREYAMELAQDEQNHVQFLRQALGARRVARPAINLDDALRAAAQAAGLGGNFDAFANENNFLLASFIFEDVGVTAYGGAASLIDNRTILDAAVRIGLVEAYHAGTIRTVLFSRGFFRQAQAISNLRDRVDGGTNMDEGIGTRTAGNITPVDNNALIYTRSAQQVLRIVYLGNANRGGFFPNGLNGNIA